LRPPERGAGVSGLRSAGVPARSPTLPSLSWFELSITEVHKAEPHPKLEVHRAAPGAPLLAPDDAAIVAIASDVPLPAARVPVVDLDDINHIVDILIRHAAPLDTVLAQIEAS